MTLEIEDNDDNENEDNDSENGATEVIFARSGSKKSGGKIVKNDTPIENAGDIPLFEDADKRGLKSAAYLKLIKLDKPGAGYKGNIPLNSTLETIYQLYGDGLFNIEACNFRHQVLRTKENIRISMGDSETHSRPSNNEQAVPFNFAEVIKELKQSQKEEIARLIPALMQAAQESKEQSKTFVDLVKTTTESAAQRDREHMRSVNEGQQGFFATMMMQSQQMFQQTLAILTMGHQHLIETLRESNNISGKTSDVDNLLKGIVVAQSIGGNDDPDWIKALDKGGNMLKHLLLLKQGSQDDTSEDKEEKESSNKTKKDRKAPISKAELLEVIRLKNAVNSRGIDFGEMVRQAREAYVDDKKKENSKEDKTDVDESESTNDSKEDSNQ